MDDPIPTCGWAKRVGKSLVPCGQPAVAVHQVWATPVEEFMNDGDRHVMALLVCREHEPQTVVTL